MSGASSRAVMDSARKPAPSQHPLGRLATGGRGLRRVGRRPGVAEGQGPQLPAMSFPESQGDVTAHREPDEHHRLRDAGGVEHRGQVVGEPFHGDGPRGGPAAAEAPQVGRDHAVVVAQRGDLPFPHPVVQRETVDQQHGRTAPRST